MTDAFNDSAAPEQLPALIAASTWAKIGSALAILAMIARIMGVDLGEPDSFAAEWLGDLTALDAALAAVIMRAVGNYLRITGKAELTLFGWTIPGGKPGGAS
ncbi:hypothetical protein LNKW23_17840 [Paralimibaculum aggregatum]|uniref:Uncharacterized protein n=1 Tax=Paralimibaculum aggregatum TaxID=3036245 RepID=A0ABQ6LJJ3_9RHOB|nr:hypothetical protein [Limibaculum sp. NKW23]GMG82571.1 hypothetical protein LNKW23_17840 [Limibaculum sp. NKW23]